MSQISVEYAKSNRAGCKGCKEKIEKGKIRIGIHTEFDDRKMTQWKHLDCFKITKKWKEVEPETIDGMEDLSPEDQEEVVLHWQSEGGGKKKAKKSTKSVKSKKSVISESEGSDGEERKIPEYDEEKMPGYTEDEWEELQNKINKLQNWKVQDLKNACKLNDQIISGAKDELIQRVADGMVLGQIPKCPECGAGRLKFNYQKAIYRCPGYMDDDEFKNCNKKFNLGDIEREEWIEVD